MFHWLRRKLGLDIIQESLDYNGHLHSNTIAHIDDLHKRMDKLETTLGPWREDGVGITDGISRGRDYLDSDVRAESDRISAEVMRKLRGD